MAYNSKELCHSSKAPSHLAYSVALHFKKIKGSLPCSQEAVNSTVLSQINPVGTPPSYFNTSPPNAGLDSGLFPSVFCIHSFIHLFRFNRSSKDKPRI
jgi:hypothetical protein